PTAAAWILKLAVKPEHLQHLLGWTQPLNAREKTDFQLVATTLGTVIIGSAWFFATSLFYPRASTAEHSRIEEFFANMRRPINAAKEGIENHDEVLYRLLGLLCLVYG